MEQLMKMMCITTGYIINSKRILDIISLYVYRQLICCHLEMYVKDDDVVDMVALQVKYSLNSTKYPVIKIS